MDAILRKFGQNEALHAVEHIRTEPNVLMWVAVVQCKEARTLTIPERAHLRTTYRDALRDGLQAQGKPFPGLGKESAEPGQERATRAPGAIGGQPGRRASPKP